MVKWKELEAYAENLLSVDAARSRWLQDVTVEIEAAAPSLEALVAEMTSDQAKALQLAEGTQTNLLLLRAMALKRRAHTLYVDASEL